MFYVDSETKQAGGRLRSERRFRLGKGIRNATRRGSCSATRGEDYELVSHIDEGSCYEKQKYQLIYEEEEAPDLD